MLSDLGLTQAEVDSIMRDITGQDTSAGDAVLSAGGTTAAAVREGAGPRLPSLMQRQSPQVAPPKPAVSATKAADSAPPMLKRAIPALKATPKAAAKTPLGPIIVGATTGLIFGGPPGAAIGAGAMWLLSKFIKPKPGTKG